MDKRQKVLVVEDDPVLRPTLVALLSREGWNVRSAGDLQAALQELENGDFDLALVDIMLNGPDDLSDRGGVQVVSRIRQQRSDAQVVILSAQKSFKLIRDLFKDLGVDDYLEKDGGNDPNALKQFMKTVRAALKRRKTKEAAITWSGAVALLAPEKTEGEFVQHALAELDFSGGFPVLKTAIQGAMAPLVPLLPPLHGAPVRQTLETAGSISGVFWSKREGSAVEIVFRGKAKSADEQLASDSWEYHPLYKRTKGQLTSLVIARPDLARGLFA